MPAVHQPARPQGDQDQPVINALDMEYFPPQPRGKLGLRCTFVTY